MLDKHFQVNITIRCKSADVVALAGSFAEHIEANCAGVVDSIEVNTHVYASKSYTAEMTLSPQREETPQPDKPDAPAPADDKPRVTRTRKPRPAPANGDYAEKVFYPEQQADLPLPAVEGAEAAPAETVTTYAAPEVTEPANAGTRELTRDDGFSALRGLIERKGNDAAKAALAKLGYVKFSDVPTERMGELLDAVDEVGA